MLRDYYLLTKPGIIRGNLMNTLGGFLLATTASLNLGLMIATLAGTALVIACACVFNNYIDRGIDAHMKRTKDRALVSGRVSGQAALTYGSVLGLLGLTILIIWTNHLTVLIGLAALALYVGVYGYFKRRTPYGTLIGAVPGALPPVAGYVAVVGRWNLAATLLFIILVCWQMAHFYSIGLYRKDEYAAAGLPIKPVVRNAAETKLSVIVYIVAFAAACSLLTLFAYTGYAFLAVMEGFALSWLWLGLKDYETAKPNKWGRKMFIFSLTVILALAVMLSVGGRLP